jgi:hypothetical protein
MARSREQTWWYLSGPRATYAVVTDHWQIVDAPPVAGEYIGKSLNELINDHIFDIVKCIENRRYGGGRPNVNHN